MCALIESLDRLNVERRFNDDRDGRNCMMVGNFNYSVKILLYNAKNYWIIILFEFDVNMGALRVVF